MKRFKMLWISFYDNVARIIRNLQLSSYRWKENAVFLLEQDLGLLAKF